MSETNDEQNEQTVSKTPENQAEQPGPAEHAVASGPASPQTSERKEQANRKNAQHSTGPKTARGKAAMRNNAWKHGLYAKDVVIREGAGQENAQEFELLLQGFERSWEPSDARQQYYVHSLVETEWRLRRAVRAEVGEIRSRANSYRADMGYSEAVLNLERKLKLLTEVHQDVERSGCLTEESQEKLDRALGKDNPSVTEWREISQLIHKRQDEELMRGDLDGEQPHEGVQPQDGVHPGNSDNESSYDGASGVEGLSHEELKSALVTQIWLEIFTLEGYLKSLKAEEDNAHEANLLACKLPSGEFLDKLIRYETALERKKERIIKLLLRLKGK